MADNAHIQLLNNGPYTNESKRYWHEIFLDKLGRCVRHGTLLVVYADGKVQAVATCYGPGETPAKSVDPNCQHWQYVERHTSDAQKDLLAEVTSASLLSRFLTNAAT
jgi:hypothetical protein